MTGIEAQLHRSVKIRQVAALGPDLVGGIACLARNDGKRSRRSGKRKVARVYTRHRLVERHRPRQRVRLRWRGTGRRDRIDQRLLLVYDIFPKNRRRSDKGIANLIRNVLPGSEFERYRAGKTLQVVHDHLDVIGFGTACYRRRSRRSLNSKIVVSDIFYVFAKRHLPRQRTRIRRRGTGRRDRIDQRLVLVYDIFPKNRGRSDKRVANLIRNVLPGSEFERYRAGKTLQVVHDHLDVIGFGTACYRRRSRRSLNSKIVVSDIFYVFAKRHRPRQRARIRRRGTGRRDRIDQRLLLVYDIFPKSRRGSDKGVANFICNVLPGSEFERYRAGKTLQIIHNYADVIGFGTACYRRRSRRSLNSKIVVSDIFYVFAKRHLPSQRARIRRRGPRLAPRDRRQPGRRVVHDVRPGSGRIRQGVARHIRNVLA